MVNHKRAARLMATDGLEAIYPKPRMNLSTPGHGIYPYLLTGLVIERANQVWMTDITYIRMRKGFLYLAAIMDWLSRYVLSWSLSNTLDAALELVGGAPLQPGGALNPGGSPPLTMIIWIGIMP